MDETFARSELEKMGEMISDGRFKDICVQGFKAVYKYIEMMMYGDPNFDIDQMQSTMRPLFVDDLSRNRDTKIAGCGIAMTASSTCSHRGKQGHYARNSWKRKDDNNNRSTGAHNSKGTRNPQTKRQHPTLELSTSGAQYTNPPGTTNGMLEATSAKPTAEWTRSHCFCCKRSENTPQRRRKAVP